MVGVDEAFQVKLKKNGNVFEVLVDFDRLCEFKKNPQTIDYNDVLVDLKIFSNLKKGEVASENLINSTFKGLSSDEILKKILLEGICQIPTTYLNKLRTIKKNQVINYIAENAINPQTQNKFTLSMISSQVLKLNFNFNPNTDFKIQAEEVIFLLRKTLPIRLCKITLSIAIPGEFCGSFYGKFRKLGIVKKEFFDENSNLRLDFEIFESILDEVCEYIKLHSNGTGTYFVLK